MPLRFGIPSIDDLLEIPITATESRTAATSLALLGPDGSGKSVLALHLASRYQADCHSRLREMGKSLAPPLIIYVSSDFNLHSAQTVWTKFGLRRPNLRQIPFERTPSAVERLRNKDLDIKLRELAPGDDDCHSGSGCPSVVKFLLEPRTASSALEIGFLDLARNTAGDDWNYVNSILAKLESVPRPQLGTGNKVLQHLVIIDSIAGFETFTGRLDAYGLEQSRRARIAQCMRNAGAHCHLVFVVEEPIQGERLPEEYVTDVVVRLRSRRQGDRALRTVEVEKARARNHAIGEHPFEIRGGEGSSTGAWENADTPRCKNAYVQAFHSLGHRSTLVALDPGKGRSIPRNTVCPFGLPYLDELLARAAPVLGDRALELDAALVSGLASGSTTAIIGDTSTGKSILGEKYLAEGFRQMLQDAISIFALVSGVPAQESHRDSLQRVCTLLSNSVITSSSERRPVPHARRYRRFKITPKTAINALLNAWMRGADASHESLLEIARRQTVPSNTSLSPRDWRLLFADTDARRAVFSELRPDPPSDESETSTTKSRSHYRPLNLADLRRFETKTRLRPGEAKEFVTGLFRHQNLRFPGILLTAGDKTVTELADRCLKYLSGTLYLGIKESWTDAQRARVAPALVASLKTLLEEQIIVRRLDIDSITAPSLFLVVQRNVLEAQQLIHGFYFPPGQSNRFNKADRIRLVIDDFRVICDQCPSIAADASLLPFLIFFLEREGVTTLVIYTDSVRPNIRPDDHISRVLQSLLKQVILTWSVPFEGRNRIAVGVIPASTSKTNGIVRELTLQPSKQYPWLAENKGGRAEVVDALITPRFELYSGLEEGRPRLVPLVVYLYNATNRFEEYITSEDALYRELFSPLSTNDGSVRVIRPLSATQYLAWRDYTHLPMDAQADHTTVFQTAGFWSLSADGGALAPQSDYLQQRFLADPIHASHQDPFGLFVGDPLSREDTHVEAHGFQRKDYFRNSQYTSRVANFKYSEYADAGLPDRVPFMWDFGFLMANFHAWEGARSRALMDGEPVADLPVWAQQFKEYRTVESVRECLHNPSRDSPSVPWRQFFGACRAVADTVRQETGADPVPFDFACTSSETLNCMVLEMWLSEIMMTVAADQESFNAQEWRKRCRELSVNTYAPPKPGESLSISDILMCSLPFEAPSRRTRKQGLREYFQTFKDQYAKAGSGNLSNWESHRSSLDARRALFHKIPLGALCLYKTWLLLLDVLDFDGILDPQNAFDVRHSRPGSSRVIATRHWYRTACQFSAKGEDGGGMADAPLLFRVPGFFSARGDSFLASSKSSRSRLLASHAMDLLSSRRANLSRMQMGLGLPVRDILADDACNQLRTGLRCRIPDPSRKESDAGKNMTVGEIRYQTLCDVGGSYGNTTSVLTDRSGASLSRCPPLWLFRNSITDYDRVSRSLQKWLARLFQWTMAYKKRGGYHRENGLEAYDSLSSYRFAMLMDYDSFGYFGELCDLLVADIAAATRHPIGDQHHSQ